MRRTSWCPLGYHTRSEINKGDSILIVGLDVQLEEVMALVKKMEILRTLRWVKKNRHFSLFFLASFHWGKNG
jgi:hypothetical protein